MDPFEALDRARDEFHRRLVLVRPEQWAWGTPCEDWNVRDLVSHVVIGSLMAARMCDGASREDVIALREIDALGDDPVGAFEDATALQAERFRATPMDQVAHHPMGDMTVEAVLGFRVGDFALHAWDLARAIGADETLDPQLVELVYEEMAPMESFIGDIGVFGSGPSGEVGDAAALQDRMLDLAGRRP